MIWLPTLNKTNGRCPTSFCQHPCYKEVDISSRVVDLSVKFRVTAIFDRCFDTKLKNVEI